MRSFSVEAKVGTFFVVGVALLAFMTMKLGAFKYGQNYEQELYALFNSAEGIIEGVPVKIAGVEVGEVRDISLENGKAKVTLALSSNMQFSGDTSAVIRTKGVLGDKYVELLPGSPGVPPLKSGGYIHYTMSPANIDTLLQQLSVIGKDLQGITGSFSRVLAGQEGEQTIRSIVENLRGAVESINRVISNNETRINETFTNINSFSKDLKMISSSNQQALNEITENIRKASTELQFAINSFNEIGKKINNGEGSLGMLINDDKTIKAVNETLENLKEVTKKLDRGEGTLGRLINEDETINKINDAVGGINDFIHKEDKLRTYVGYRGEYLFGQAAMKSYISLKIQPSEDKYYLLQAIDDPAGRRENLITTTSDGTTTVERKEEINRDKLKFSAQIAKRYYDVGLRGGMFESTGGVAADYYLLNDRLVLSAEAFDFDPDRPPHLKVKADYTPFNYVYLTAGFDDWISSNGARSPFLGAGIHFSDDDIKLLLTGVPIPK